MHIIQTIQKYKMLSPGDHVLIAVSGGGDSVALLYSLLELKEDFSLTLFAAHVNHNLRGDESQQDEGFVQRLCHGLGIQLLSHSADVKFEAKNCGLSIEEAARKIRYAFLYKAAKKCSAKKIALGHNQDDNAETLLLRLCRGTGLTGLGGIPPIREAKKNITLIRPLIETDRSTIDSYLCNKGISYCTDSSNFDKSFMRNRIRHDVIPTLQEINPTASAQLAKTALLLREESMLLEELTCSVFQECLSHTQTSQDQVIRLHIPTLCQSPASMQRRVIRMGLHKAGGLKDISQKHISQIETLITNQTGKKFHLPGLLFAQREYDFLVLSKLPKLIQKKIDDTTPFCFKIIINEPVFIPILNCYALASIEPNVNLGKIPYTTSLVNSLEICTKYFNYDKIIGELHIRTRCPGDRIAITIGNKKLKDEFCDRKIPGNQRDTIPLLAMGNNILWIIDKDSKNERISSDYAVQDGCKVLKVSVLKKEPTKE
ncbi:MAG: tRNA lysidine(34) synthetase TilS [Defluviitaleaceae bacterium]|nr:tRNA lysidine(34) synthetase TilS [Defluviitaleaceae bacterium]